MRKKWRLTVTKILHNVKKKEIIRTRTTITKTTRKLNWKGRLTKTKQKLTKKGDNYKRINTKKNIEEEEEEEEEEEKKK